MTFFRLHWAGTEAADCWAGYMDGAVQSGIRAAEEILCTSERMPEVSDFSGSSVYEQQDLYFAEERKSKMRWTNVILLLSAAAVVSGLISNRYIKLSWG